MAITSIEPTEFAEWASIFRTFVGLMNATLPESQYENSWGRIQDPNGDLRALVARDEKGEIVGLAHYLFMMRSWKSTPVVYLEGAY